MIIVAIITDLSRMFESSILTSQRLSLCILSFTSLVFIIMTSKNIIIISQLLKLLFICILIKFFFLVPIWIYTSIAIFIAFILHRITSLIERLLLLLFIVKACWWLMILILRNLTNIVLLLSIHSRMLLIIGMWLVILGRLSILVLRSVIWYTLLENLWLLSLVLEL